MNRRSFFSKLATACVVIALAPRLAFKDAPDVPRINPEWVNAKHEILFLSPDGIWPVKQ